MTIIQMNDGGIEQVVNEVKEFSNKIKALPRQMQNADIQISV